MELYLVQHSESKSKEEDPERGLSDLGFSNIRKMAEFARKLDICVDTIFHSDKLRAKQTANELADAVHYMTGLKQRDGIAPMDEIIPMKDEINKSDKNIMIVGHLPYLDKLSSALLCGDQNKNILGFQCGCIVKIGKSERAEGWDLQWMITPGIC